MNLSIIIPAYNEENTLKLIVEKVNACLSDIVVEIIIINDCSIDRTLHVANELEKDYSQVKVINNEINLGKSRSVKNGLLVSHGDFVIIQDADAEYNPEDIRTMFDIAVNNNYDFVYGNRFGKKNKVIYWRNYFGNKMLSFYSNLFTFPRLKKLIPDMEVCYKLIRGDIAREIASKITSNSNFGIEPEITARLARYKKSGNNTPLLFTNLPIDYNPRTIEEGKKIKITDGIKALIEILKFNLF